MRIKRLMVSTRVEGWVAAVVVTATMLVGLLIVVSKTTLGSPLEATPAQGGFPVPGLDMPDDWDGMARAVAAMPARFHDDTCKVAEFQELNGYIRLVYGGRGPSDPNGQYSKPPWLRADDIALASPSTTIAAEIDALFAQLVRYGDIVTQGQTGNILWITYTAVLLDETANEITVEGFVFGESDGTWIVGIVGWTPAERDALVETFAQSVRTTAELGTPSESPVAVVDFSDDPLRPEDILLSSACPVSI